jgi:hypothetical protein
VVPGELTCNQLAVTATSLSCSLFLQGVGSSCVNRVTPVHGTNQEEYLLAQVAAALALATRPAGAAIRTILGRAPRLFLMAAGSNNQANGDAQQQVVVGEFFTKVRNVARFRCEEAVAIKLAHSEDAGTAHQLSVARPHCNLLRNGKHVHS